MLFRSDVDVIRAVGFGCTVPNASKKIKEISDYITVKRGGEGAVREVIDYILENKKEE